MNRFGRGMTLTVLCLGIVNDARGADELIVNGSFELPVISGIDQQFTAPSTAIQGWVLTERTVDINHTSSIFGVAHSGDQMVDINGQNNGTLEQTFATTPGLPYLLTLFYANNPNPSEAVPVYNADVTLFGNGMLYTEFLTHSGSTPSNMQWTLLSRFFVANSNTSTLQLRSRMLGFNGVVFDSVSVVRVPEPTSSVVPLSLVVVPLARLRHRRAGCRKIPPRRVRTRSAQPVPMKSADKRAQCL